MSLNQRSFAFHLRTACHDDAVFRRNLLLKRAGKYVYTAGPLADNHPDTKFAHAYSKAYTAGVDKKGREKIQTYACKALQQVRREEEDDGGSVALPALALRFGKLELNDDKVSAMSKENKETNTKLTAKDLIRKKIKSLRQKADKTFEQLKTTPANTEKHVALSNQLDKLEEEIDEASKQRDVLMAKIY